MRRSHRRLHEVIGPCAAAVLAHIFTPMATLAASAPAVATRIVADTAPGRSLGTTVSVSGPLVTIDGGTVAGRNLFESFSTFSLAVGGTAQWVYTGAAVSPADVANVISRVTGAAPSQINGTLDSTALPNANFYFINPSGILFGAGARIDVPASAYISTASELRFGAGRTAFSATSPGSTLSMAAPASFGFDGGEGDLTIDSVSAGFFQGAGTLSLSAANLGISNVPSSAPIQAGGLYLFAVGDQGLDLPLAGEAANDTAFTGNLGITDAALQRIPSTSPGATLQIDGGAVTLQDAVISSAPANLFLPYVRGDITIGAQALVLDGSTISSDTAAAVGGGFVTIASDTLTLSNGSIIKAQSCGVTCLGNGPGGVITLEGRSTARSLALSIDSTSSITTDTNGPGDAGVISITASSVQNDGSISSSGLQADAGAGGVISISGGDLRNYGSISTNTGNGHDAGSITIAVNSVEDYGVISSAAEVGAKGRSGDIQLAVDSLKVLDGGMIETNSDNALQAGAINVFVRPGAPSLTAPAVLIDGENAQGRFSQITSQNIYNASCGAQAYCGNAGTIGVNANFTVDPPGPLATAADGVTVSNGGRITTDSVSGSAGDIAINIAVGSLLTLEGKTNPGVITASSVSNTPGMIYILGGSGVVLNGAEIEGLGPYPGSESFVIIRSLARVESSDRPNTIKTTGLLELDSPQVDLSGATTLLNPSFIDAGKVLRGQCGSLAASGETSQLIDRIKGPYGDLSLPPSGGAVHSSSRLPPPACQRKPGAP